jgi:predicted house-cleaning noncanonical NTP pyrophosphatase (MazG superfamily)
MNKIVYNKLIRDRIPEIIEKSGKTAIVQTLENKQYHAKLNEKLSEELQEYQESKSIEELADIVEVIYAIVKTQGNSIEEFERIRIEKGGNRGYFEKKLLLVEVND